MVVVLQMGLSFTAPFGNVLGFVFTQLKCRLDSNNPLCSIQPKNWLEYARARHRQGLNWVVRTVRTA